ncbi:MAG: polysaccharide deacetylase family protein [Hyphomicrobiaceae bacterium]
MIEPVGRQAPMKPDQRIDFLAIVDRPKLSLPDNRRIIAWPVVNVEEWDVTREMPRTMLGPPGGQTILPDIPNWTWHEYGMRVGIWRMMDALSARQIKPTICVNAKVLESRPALAKAMHQAGWEFMAHCYEQMHISKVTDQQAMIQQTVDVIQTYTGSFPAGWLGPGLGQTFDTADYIAEAGFKWFADYVMDDLPFWVKTLHRPLLALPYTVELNDIPIMTGSRHESHVMLDRVKSALQVLHNDAVRHDSVRVICVSVHPYISGAAHRFGYFEEILDTLKQHPSVVFMTSEEIYNWYIAHDPPPIQ